MGTQHVSYRAEFGVALHEHGLNALSAGLRAERPELFAFRTEIPIVPPSASSPGHTLTLYAVVDEPLAFNLYPVAATPAIPVDGFFVAANILFTLSDSELGTITRIRIKVEAAGQVVQRDDKLVVRLLNKPDGLPWFEIVELRGEHPGSVMRLVDGVLNSEGEIVTGLNVSGSDPATARTFRAIMDYLITLFLREGLTRTVTEFPLPDLNDLVEAGPLGKLPGRSIYVRNDSLYLTLGQALAGDGDFPDGVAGADLRIGATEHGLRRIVDAMGRMPVPISIGHDHTTIQVISNDFHISTIHFNLRPGHEKFLGFVFFGGTLQLRLQFEAFGGWIRTPYLPLPIDDSLSHFGGLFKPYLQVDDNTIQLRIRPDQDFLEAWYLFVVTNYRGLFRDLFRRAAEAVRDQLRRNKFCKIPIIGWIVCGVIDLFGEVLGWLLGAVLDAFMSGILTIILNTVGRAVLQFVGDQTFRVFELQQEQIRQMTGLRVRSGSVLQVADGREGELQLRLGFSEGGFPTPPPPVPVPPVQEPTPLPPFPSPAPGTLPEYKPKDFEPLLALPASNWPEGKTETYGIEIVGEVTSRGDMSVRYERVGDTWRLTKAVHVNAGNVEAVFHAEYANDGTRPLRGSYVSRMPGTGASIEVRHQIDFADAGKAAVSISMPGDMSWQSVVDVFEPQFLEFEEMWLFRLAYCDLAAMKGKFARIEVSDALEYTNWARQVPVEVTVSEGQMTWPAGSGTSLPIWIVASQDEEGYIQLNIDKAGGLLTAKIVRSGSELSIVRAG